MPRQAGIDAAGALQHIIIRGIERRAIFKNDTDRDDFIDRLGNLLQETETACYAWKNRGSPIKGLVKRKNTPSIKKIHFLIDC